MMLDITTIISMIGGALILLLSVMLKSARLEKNIAEKERDSAEAKAQGADARVKAHEKRQEIEQNISTGMHNPQRLRDPYNRDSDSKL